MVSILHHISKYPFLVDYHCKLKSELIGTKENSQKWIFFLQGLYFVCLVAFEKRWEYICGQFSSRRFMCDEFY